MKAQCCTSEVLERSNLCLNQSSLSDLVYHESSFNTHERNLSGSQSQISVSEKGSSITQNCLYQSTVTRYVSTASVLTRSQRERRDTAGIVMFFRDGNVLLKQCLRGHWGIMSEMKDKLC